MYQLSVASFRERGWYYVMVGLYANLQDENGTGFIHKKWTFTNQRKCGKHWYTI